MEVCALSGDSDMAEGVDSAPADWQELARDWKKAVRHISAYGPE